MTSFSLMPDDFLEKVCQEKYHIWLFSLCLILNTYKSWILGKFGIFRSFSFDQRKPENIKDIWYWYFKFVESDDCKARCFSGLKDGLIFYCNKNILQYSILHLWSSHYSNNRSLKQSETLLHIFRGFCWHCYYIFIVFIIYFWVITWQSCFKCMFKVLHEHYHIILHMLAYYSFEAYYQGIKLFL